MVIGMQQRGFQPKGSVGLQVIDLLLSTTTNLIAVSGQVGRTASDTNGSQNILYVTSTADTVSFRVVNTENYAEEAMPFFWLLIAVVQQWGYEESNEIVTLLQAYTTAYIPVGCAALLDSLFSLTIQDNTSFYRPLRTTAVYWLTIGR